MVALSNQGPMVGCRHTAFAYISKLGWGTGEPPESDFLAALVLKNYLVLKHYRTGCDMRSDAWAREALM